jgi:hypothetical protein
VPTNSGTLWTVNGGTAAGTCSISVGVLTCNIGNLAAGASANVHLISPTTTATCGQVSNTGKVTTSNDGSNSSSASVGVTCPNAQIAPTNTTCQAFAGGTSTTLGQIMYTAPAGGGAIAQSVNPGVFFYWDKVTAPAGMLTYTLTQNGAPGTPTPPGMFAIAAGSGVFDANCNSVSATIKQNADGSVTSVQRCPIRSGHIVAATFTGTISHAGGLTFSHNRKHVTMTNFVINTQTKQLTASVAGRSVPSFNLNLASLKHASEPHRTMIATNVELTVTSNAARALNNGLGINTFKAGQYFGVATLVVAFKP